METIKNIINSETFILIDYTTKIKNSFDFVIYVFLAFGCLDSSRNPLSSLNKKHLKIYFSRNLKDLKEINKLKLTALRLVLSSRNSRKSLKVIDTKRRKEFV